MKSSALLLTGSIALNATILGALTMRPTLAPSGFRDFFGGHAAAAPQAAPVRVVKSPPRPKLGASFETGGDLPTLVSRLRAAGFPPAVIRQIAMAEVSTRFNAR